MKNPLASTSHAPDDDRAEQDRGRLDAYNRYLAAMDGSMRQKVALTAAHLLGRGKVADMGMGSGAGSHALAALYPELEVVGVDLDDKMVELARERHRLPNLSFVQGDIAQPVFPASSLDAIMDSSVLHHVTTFNDYSYAAAAQAITAQVAQLAPHGVLVVRDFLDPGEGRVLLDLPTDDGDASDDPSKCSTAALFERFAGEFRSLSPQPGFSYERVGGASGRRRYSLPRKLAVEFVLRKDYRVDWVQEVKEEYTYFTQAEFERRFAALGLRVLVSSPLVNPWIVRNRFKDKFEMWGEDGKRLDHPATNYVIVGEKVAPGEGVRCVDAGEAAPLRFLEMTHFAHRENGRVRDLVRRPNATVDVIPWFRSNGEVFVVVRGSYPRPVLAGDYGSHAIDGSRAPHYVTEPLTIIQGDKPVAQTAEELLASVGIPPRDIRVVTRGATYYPSPGGIQEEVRSMLIEIAPTLVKDPERHAPGLSTGGRVRAVEIGQLLRAAQVGGLPDARLELNAYALLAQLGRSSGPWIADVGAAAKALHAVDATEVSVLTARPRRRAWEKVGADKSRGFLETRCRRFHELDAAGAVVGDRSLELVVPKAVSINTATVALLARRNDEWFIALDDDDLPAAQCFEGGSELLVTPAWRLPRTVDSPSVMTQWVRAKLAEEYDVEVGEIWELGGRYHPSPGVTPEVVHPLATTLVKKGTSGRPLIWTKLRDLVHSAESDGLLRDGHLRIAALRAAHALS